MIEDKGINTVMNSFNRLSYTYRFILIEKYYLIIIKKCSKLLNTSKIMPIFVIQKKTIKTYDYEKRN
jgi:hypothetical protein